MFRIRVHTLFSTVHTVGRFMVNINKWTDQGAVRNDKTIYKPNLLFSEPTFSPALKNQFLGIEGNST